MKVERLDSVFPFWLISDAPKQGNSDPVGDSADRRLFNTHIRSNSEIS